MIVEVISTPTNTRRPAAFSLKGKGKQGEGPPGQENQRKCHGQGEGRTVGPSSFRGTNRSLTLRLCARLPSPKLCAKQVHMILCLDIETTQPKPRSALGRCSFKQGRAIAGGSSMEVGEPAATLGPVRRRRYGDRKGNLHGASERTGCELVQETSCSGHRRAKP